MHDETWEVYVNFKARTRSKVESRVKWLRDIPVGELSSTCNMIRALFTTYQYTSY